MSKVVRLRAEAYERLLERRNAVKVVYLIRDPRGTMNSRWEMSWCRHEECASPKRLCDDLVEDFEAVRRLQIRYPDRFSLLRFEDFAKNPIESLRRVVKFAGLADLTEAMKKFVATHTTAKQQQVINVT